MRLSYAKASPERGSGANQYYIPAGGRYTIVKVGRRQATRRGYIAGAIDYRVTPQASLYSDASSPFRGAFYVSSPTEIKFPLVQ